MSADIIPGDMFTYDRNLENAPGTQLTSWIRIESITLLGDVRIIERHGRVEDIDLGTTHMTNLVNVIWLIESGVWKLYRRKQYGL
jgi:hypothetical protein